LVPPSDEPPPSSDPVNVVPAPLHAATRIADRARVNVRRDALGFAVVCMG
jgi:hypothetical protein